MVIPKGDIEARHDYMLSVIKDRVDNADMYEREYFSKYPNYGYSRRKIGFSIDDLWEPKKKKYFPGRRRIMNSSTKCNHRPVHGIENKLYPDYDYGLFQRMYIELKEEVREWDKRDGRPLTEAIALPNMIKLLLTVRYIKETKNKCTLQLSLVCFL